MHDRLTTDKRGGRFGTCKSIRACGHNEDTMSNEREMIEAELKILRSAKEPDMDKIRPLTQRLTNLPGSESLDVILVDLGKKYKSIKI